MALERKDLRCKLDEGTHKALSVIAEHEGVTMDRWVVELVQREVAQRMTLAKRLAAVGELTIVPANHRPRWMYFVQRGADGPIKIGSTTRGVSSRLQSLQTACAEPLRLLAALEERDGLSESALHRRFRRYQKEGEWFDPVPELLRLIDELAPGSQRDAG